MSSAGPSVLERDLQNAYVLAIPARFPRMRVFRRNIMAARLTGGHFVRAGIPGQCDLYALVKPERPREHYTDRAALPIEIECKGARTRDTDKQAKWRAFCEEWGIPYLMLRARTDETPGDTVGRWLGETAELLARYGA